MNGERWWKRGQSLLTLLPLPRRLSHNKRNDCRSSRRKVKLSSSSSVWINSSKNSSKSCLSRIGSSNNSSRQLPQLDIYMETEEMLLPQSSSLKRVRNEEEKVTKKEKSLVEAEQRNPWKKKKTQLPLLFQQKPMIQMPKVRQGALLLPCLRYWLLLLLPPTHPQNRNQSPGGRRFLL